MPETSEQTTRNNPGKAPSNAGQNDGTRDNEVGGMTVDGEHVEPEKHTLSRLTDTVFIRSIALTGIFIILLLYTIRVAAPILIPITLAYILSLLLAPLVRRMRNARIPEPVGAAIVLLVFLAITASGIYGLSVPAQEWSGRVPELVQKIDDRLRPLREPLKEARDAAEKVSKIADPDAESSESATGTGEEQNPLKQQLEQPEQTEQPNQPKQPEQTEQTEQTEQVEQKVTVEVDDRSWMADLLSGTPRVLANLGIVIVLMYFLLAGGDSALNKVVSATPRLQDKKRAVTIMRDIQIGISHYLLTCTIINITLGVVISTALYFLGMPNPMLWGAMVGLLNFAPYIGPALSLVIVTPVALLSFPTIGQALLIPVVVFGINILEGQLITPQIVGRRLALSPVVVFISIVVWGWLWGIPGALMAIPIVAAVKIICERIDVLNPIADFIGVAPRVDRRSRPEAAV